MHLELPDAETRVEIVERPMDDDDFFALCAENRKLRIEREPTGEILVMPPAGGETSHRNTGKALDSNSEFFLPNGAARGPDAAWIHNSRLAQLTKEQKRRLFYLCPDFVVELTSPSDRLSKVQAKMVEWIENGVELGWLIDADQRTVYICRPARDPERLVDVDHADGEGRLAGFRLDLVEIWQGL
jgi:Uma2 family endonuclease